MKSRANTGSPISYIRLPTLRDVPVFCLALYLGLTTVAHYLKPKLSQTSCSLEGPQVQRTVGTGHTLIHTKADSQKTGDLDTGEKQHNLRRKQSFAPQATETSGALLPSAPLLSCQSKAAQLFPTTPYCVESVLPATTLDALPTFIPITPYCLQQVPPATALDTLQTFIQIHALLFGTFAPVNHPGH